MLRPLAAFGRLGLRSLSTQVLVLAGAPLPKPKLSSVGKSWELRQTFDEEDDPDRTDKKHDWTTPAFLTAVDPVARAPQTTAEDIDVSNVGGFVPDFSFARAVDGVLTEPECAEVLQSLNAKGFTPALVNIGNGMQQYQPKYRDSYRVVQDSPPLANWLLEVLRPRLSVETMEGQQTQWRVPQRLTVSEINERCRFLCYVPGQQFKPHADGGQMRRRRAQGSPSSARDLSVITIQLYLHNMPPECGGATNFIGQPDARYQPRAGSVLLFTQELMHEGAIVSVGRKFTMRSEVMYSGYSVEEV